MNKKWTWPLVILATGLVMTACGSNEKASKEEKAEVKLTEVGAFPIVDQPLTMTMMGPNVGLAEWSDMAFFQDYAEKTGIEFEFNTPPVSDFATKLNLAFASGDLPDVIFGTGPNELTAAMEMDYGSQGILLPLEEMIEENMPNLWALMEAEPEIRKSITTPDGHIYSLPMINRDTTAIWYMGPMWYRGDWLKAVGAKTPTTVDEFYTVLKQFKEEDPNGNGQADEIPITDVKLDSARIWLMSAFGMKTRGIQEADGVVSYTPISENYQAYLAFMNKLYTEKLLDPEVYGQSSEQKKAKGQNNQIGVFTDWFSYFTTGKDEEDALDDVMFHPLTSEFSPNGVVPGSPRLVRSTFAITNKCPAPKAALRWVDYFYSPEGAYYLEKGPEGSLWEWTENSEGEKVRVYSDKIDQANLEDERGAITPMYGLTVPVLSAPTGNVILPTADAKMDTRFEEFIAKETAEKIVPFSEVPFPLLYLTTAESEEVRDTVTDLNTYVEQMEAKFITGVEPLENWGEYVQTIESMGVERFVEVYQGAYDRWAAN